MTTMFERRDEPIVHVRHDGRSHEQTLARLGITMSSSDDEIRSAAASFFDLGRDAISKLVVERNTATGNITLRPEAVFG